jgi:SAM-dependent methyltransferase
MLDLARGHGGPATLRYVEDNAEQLTRFDDGSFDGVNCQLGLMDVADLDAALGAVRRVLRPRGWFTLVIGHPCFLAPDAETITGSDGTVGRWVGDYLTERFWRSPNPQGVRRAGNHHRTVSTYLNGLTRHGFGIDHAEEPPASDLLATEQPEYQSLPIFLAIRSSRLAS